MRLGTIGAGILLCGLLTAGFLMGTAASGARDDPPLKTQAFTDPAGDKQADAADITGGTVANWADGTLGFTILVPGLTRLTSRDSVAVFLDADQKRDTGQDGSDYAIVMAANQLGVPVSGLYRSVVSPQPPTSDVGEQNWYAVSSSTLKGELDPGSGVTFRISAQELGISTAFDFRAQTSYFTGYLAGVPGPIYYDNAPDPPAYITYELGTAATTSTTTTTATTTPPPAPEKLSGHVGPGRSIALSPRAKPGKAAITIRDRSHSDDFHLSGPGLNRKTGIAFEGTVTWTVTLRPGTYKFSSDAHPALHGTLHVS